MIMVTGGSGNIGRRVLARLSETYDVLNVDRASPGDAWRGRTEALDLTDRESLSHLTESFDAIVHLAAIPNPYVATWDEVLRVNMLSTFHVLQFAVERGIPRVIFGSSESASGWGIHGKWYRPDYVPIDEKHRSLPSEVYSFTKAFGDQLCQAASREHDLQTICLRYTFVTFESLYPAFLAQLRSGEPREALGTSYAWIDVEDVAAAIACALQMPMQQGQSETFYLTAREHYGTLDTVEMVRRNWGDDVPVDRSYYANNPRGSLFDLRKAETMLGWTPQWTVERLMAEHG
ncbi:MAG: NAD(P)-dependent oxidoreductase [Chthonomonadales bacterium]|nr:NAD(P)-dependent oxidoreductase [Chthonomonadales bacterium]